MNAMSTTKRWHAFVMLALSDFGVGNLLAKLATAWGN